MITFVRLKRQLLLRFYHLFLHFLDFTSKHHFSWCGRIDTIRFNGNDYVSIVFKEVMSVEGDNTSSINEFLVSDNFEAGQATRTY